MGWRRWGLVLTVLAGLSVLAVAGRLLDVAEDRPPAARSTAPVQSLTIATVPPPRVTTALWRPLRLPSLRRDGSCPATPAAGPPVPGSNNVAAVTLGDGPVYPVLFKVPAGQARGHSLVARCAAPLSTSPSMSLLGVLWSVRRAQLVR